MAINQPEGGGSVGEKPMSRAEYLDRTGIQMYQREVFADPLVNITLGAYSDPEARPARSGRQNLAMARKSDA